MKMTLQSTNKIVEINGIKARIWEGETEKGIPVHAFIPRVSAEVRDRMEEFEKDLHECNAPSAAVEAYPFRMLL